MSATADRSARAIQRSLFMAAMVIRGFSWASRERGREKSRELREKPLIHNRSSRPRGPYVDASMFKANAVFYHFSSNSPGSLLFPARPFC